MPPEESLDRTHGLGGRLVRLLLVGSIFRITALLGHRLFAVAVATSALRLCSTLSCCASASKTSHQFRMSSCSSRQALLRVVIPVLVDHSRDTELHEDQIAEVADACTLAKLPSDSRPQACVPAPTDHLRIIFTK